MNLLNVILIIALLLYGLGVSVWLIIWCEFKASDTYSVKATKVIVGWLVASILIGTCVHGCGKSWESRDPLTGGNYENLNSNMATDYF